MLISRYGIYNTGFVGVRRNEYTCFSYPVLQRNKIDIIIAFKKISIIIPYSFPAFSI